MAISTSLNGANRTVTLTYTAENQKVLDVLTDAAKSLYITQRKFQVIDDETELSVPWEELTNVQKLSVIGQGVRAWLLQTARDWHQNEQFPLVQDAVIAEGEIKYAI